MPAENSTHVVHMRMRLGVNGASEDFLMKCDSSLTETSLLYLNEQKYRSSQIREKKLLYFIPIWLLLKLLPKVQIPKLFYLIATLIYCKICIFIGNSLHYDYRVKIKFVISVQNVK